MKRIINIAVFVLMVVEVNAQTITYGSFMKAVAEKNISYLAEKHNIDVAEANVQASKVFNDPELSVTYTNNQDWNLKMGQGVDVELSYNLDLTGVRRNRIRVARTEKEMSNAVLSVFFSSLRLEAAKAWAEAWRLKECCRVMGESLEDLMQIAKSDSLRLSVGDINRTDATQSRLEAQMLNGELSILKAQFKNALLSLSRLCGGEPISDIEDGPLPEEEPVLNVDQLLKKALSLRADLKAAELQKTLSEQNVRLLKASRSFEMGITLGYSYSNTVRNEIAPAPSFNSLSVGVSIPLKFSSMNKGALYSAKIQAEQSRRYYDEACLQVHTETMQAYNSYLAVSSVARRYDSSVLTEAKGIAEARKEGYLKGESSLVEMLSAQQTFREVMTGYIESSANRYLSVAELEYAAGGSLR